MKSKLRLFASLLIAAFGSNPLRRDFWRRLGRAVKLWVGGLKPGARVSDVVYQWRVSACRQCPVSYQKFGLLTCGSPLAKGPQVSKGQKKPCHCDMLTKARLKAATCWLDENTHLNYGWRRIGAQNVAPIKAV